MGEKQTWPVRGGDKDTQKPWSPPANPGTTRRRREDRGRRDGLARVLSAAPGREHNSVCGKETSTLAPATLTAAPAAKTEAPAGRGALGGRAAWQQEKGFFPDAGASSEGERKGAAAAQVHGCRNSEDATGFSPITFHLLAFPW